MYALMRKKHAMRRQSRMTTVPSTEGQGHPVEEVEEVEEAGGLSVVDINERMMITYRSDTVEFIQGFRVDRVEARKHMDVFYKYLEQYRTAFEQMPKDTLFYLGMAKFRKQILDAFYEFEELNRRIDEPFLIAVDFIDTEILLIPNAQTKGIDLTERLKRWRTTHTYSVGQRELNNAILALLYEQGCKRMILRPGGVHYIGIALKNPIDLHTDDE